MLVLELQRKLYLGALTKAHIDALGVVSLSASTVFTLPLCYYVQPLLNL